MANPNAANIRRLPPNPTEEDIIAFMESVDIRSRFERKLEWDPRRLDQVTLYVPDFLEGKDDAAEIPAPPAGSAYLFTSWAHIYMKYASSSSYTADEVKFYCALWAYTGEKGCPLLSAWTSDLKWEYVNGVAAAPVDKLMIGQVEYTQESLAVYGYITWALSLRFAERNQDTDLAQHAVFNSVQRFFPDVQSPQLLVKMVDFTTTRLRGFFRSGAPACASLSCVLYCPTILKNHDGQRRAYQLDSNREIPNIEIGWYGLMSIGVFMSGFSAYETVVEGLRKHRKCLQDITAYFPFDPFIEYFNKAAETDVKLGEDPWYGLCQKLFEGADTPMSANKFPVPSYVGICFQTITSKGMVPPSMPGIEILDTVRARYAAYVYYILESWAQPPVLSGPRKVPEVRDKKLVGRKDFHVTEEDLESYVSRPVYGGVDLTHSVRHNPVPTQVSDQVAHHNPDETSDSERGDEGFEAI